MLREPLHVRPVHSVLLAPTQDGPRSVGLQAPVEILVDRWGVPHIYATNTYDVFFGQGFNAARDRLWQLDLWRRRGLGEMAKVFGPAYVEQDRAARLFLYRGDMHAEWIAYSSDTKRIVENFVAGLNAYIPLLTMGLLARYTEAISLPAGWSWLANGWTLIILGLLLAIEVVADKVPIVDHVNDVVQTFVRPTAGGLAFGAGSASETVTVSDPGSFFTSHQWVPIVAGGLIALGVHGVKAASRPVVNASTAGLGAPVASTAEPAGPPSPMGAYAASEPATVVMMPVARSTRRTRL